MNKNSSRRLPLKVSEQNIHLPQSQTQQLPKSLPKSSRKLSSQTFKGMSFYTKQKTQIPTKKQAKHRQKQIVQFHNKNFHQRQRRLEEIFKENCRIYKQINTQKSHYLGNFNKNDEKISRRGHSVSYSDYNLTNIFDNEKASRQDICNFLASRLERRFSCSFAQKSKQKQVHERKTQLGNVQSEVGIELRRYEKNKTETSLRRNRRVIFESTNKDLPQFIESNAKNIPDNPPIGPIPVYIRFKRRPSSGFRG